VADDLGVGGEMSGQDLLYREAIIRLADGNMGALSVLKMLVEAYRGDAIVALEIAGVKGPGIWALYKNKFDRDLEKLVEFLVWTPNQNTVYAAAKEALEGGERG